MCVYSFICVGIGFTPFGQTTVIETGVFFNSAFKALENLSTNALDAQYTLYMVWNRMRKYCQY